MKARYEKVDNNTIRIYIEKPSDVPIEQLIENRKKMLESIAQEEQDLAEHKAENQIRESIKASKQIIANIDEMLAKCAEFGIVPKSTEEKK